MKIGVLFDAMSALGPNPDGLILESVEAVEDAIAAWKHDAVRIPVNPDGRWVERVRRGKFDLVFNLCEGIDGEAVFEPMVISVLELFGIPYTGNSSATAALCLHKNLVNTLLDRAGLPVPRWLLVHRGEDVDGVGFPAICKPAAEDASIGIEQRSVVRSTRALLARVEAMHERWDDVLIQRFIDGREVNVGIVGDEVLPIAEINFGEMPRGMWKIVSYQLEVDHRQRRGPWGPRPPAPLICRVLSTASSRESLSLRGARSAARDTAAPISASIAPDSRGCSR